jgi:hypothetical protein
MISNNPGNPEMTYDELLNRSIIAGKQIHLSNKEAMINQQMKADSEAEAKMIENLMKPTTDRFGKVLSEGLSYEQAMALIQRNRLVDEKNAEKLSKKTK